MVMDVDRTYIQDPILDSDDMKKLFVSKIPLDVSDEDVQSFFENFSGGSVTEKTIIRKKDAKTYNFGYLTFESSHIVDEIIFNEKELIINGTTLEVNRSCPKKTGVYHNKTKKLFVGGIPKSGFKEEDLKKYFEDRHDPKYGTIESISVIKKKDGDGKPTEENKGFAFVTLSSEHLADTISIQHASIEINGNKLEVKKSDRDGNTGQGVRGGARGGGQVRGRGSRGGSRGGGQYAGGYGSYTAGYGGIYGAYHQLGYGGYGYQSYPQYGVSSAVRGSGGSRGGKDRGGARGGRGKRSAPYEKKT